MALGNYEGISIREAMEKINNKNNGWFLPVTQRQYVWGGRDSSEEYICLLLDSILKGYPIGGLVLWETDEKIPFREFLGDYYSGAVARVVPEERWNCHKSLVYDGQQRLQTLHSVLYHRFNGRVLYFDLLFDQSEDVEETGFFFKNPQDEVGQYVISMITLSNTNPGATAKIALRKQIKSQGSLSEEQETLLEENFEKLWSVFVERDKKSLAYFPVQSNTPEEVDEVFRRLNTGGVQLTQLELVLSKIKAESTFFEESLWDITKEIKEATNGYEFSAYEIMQLIYLLVFRTTKVDESRVDKENVVNLIRMLDSVKVVLPHFFKFFFYEGFHINAKWLILRQQAILPMIVYCVSLYRRGYKWELYKINTKTMRTYFIKSQLCDWNTQTMVTAFSREADSAAIENREFPLNAITSIAVDKHRTSEVSFYQLAGPIWFSLKILTPSRLYLFNERTPQIDHIFPKDLHHGQSDAKEYAEKVDVIWNMQPTPAGVNRQKWNTHPVKYFSSTEGRPFLNSYDFLPDTLSSDEWKNEDAFLAFRKQKMSEFMQSEYDIVLQEND